jgi:hypothetical protein
MKESIIEIINRNYDQFRNNPEYYLKIEMGQYKISNIFEQLIYLPSLIDYLNQKKKINLQSEYYLYQYQSQFYQRDRLFHSTAFINKLHDIVSYRGRENGIEYRISLHQKKMLKMFSQRMNYHNIVFVSQKQWQLTDNCVIDVYSYRKKNHDKMSEQLEYFNVEFNIKIPLSDQSLDEIITEIYNLELHFKHKCDKKRMYHSLDSVLEYEQPPQELILGNEPLHHHEE